MDNIHFMMKNSGKEALNYHATGPTVQALSSVEVNFPNCESDSLGSLEEGLSSEIWEQIRRESSQARRKSSIASLFSHFNKISPTEDQVFSIQVQGKEEDESDGMGHSSQNTYSSSYHENVLHSLQKGTLKQEENLFEIQDPSEMNIKTNSLKKKARRKSETLSEILGQIPLFIHNSTSSNLRSSLPKWLRALSVQSIETSFSEPVKGNDDTFESGDQTSEFPDLKLDSETNSLKTLHVDDMRIIPSHTDSKENFKKYKYRSKKFTSEGDIELEAKENFSFKRFQFHEIDLECWMSKLPIEKQKIPLHQLLIPGSHDSFSYSLDWGELSPDSPSVVSYIAACIPCIAWPALLRWTVTQRATVYEQLTHGIRYFDIRVAKKDKKFHFVHGLYGAVLEDLLAEVRDFLIVRSGEVVLLDFQHLYGLTKEDHIFLGALLRTIFSGLICPPYESLSHLSLLYLVKRKYQVLIFYRHSDNPREEGFWPDTLLPNPWPKSTDVETMMEFVNEEIDRKSLGKFFVTQCVLTPTGSYLSRNVNGSLKENLADPCNKEVLKWVSKLSSKNRLPNVIMTDFVDNDNWAIPKAIIRKNFK